MLTKFSITIDQKNIATQIACLLNNGGQLIQCMTPQIILSNSISYIIELEGDVVIGVVGIEKKTNRVSEIKHLCVLQDKRKHGLGLKLLRCAIVSANTEIVYGNVDIENIANIKNNLKLRMLPVCRHSSRNRTIITFARRLSSGH